MLSYFEIFPLPPSPVGWGGGGLKKYRFSRQFMKCLTFEIVTHKTPNPRWGGVGLIFVYYFSLQFMTFPGLLIFWPPKIPTATPFGGGGLFYRFSRQFMKFTGLLKFWPPNPPARNPRGGMGKKTNFIDFLDSSWHFPVFWFFDPLKFPLRPLLVGGGDFFIDFLDSSWNLPDFLNVDPQPPLPGTPRGGMCKKKKIYRFSGQFMTFPRVLTFDLLTP